jgi:hypothetical protein
MNDFINNILSRHIDPAGNIIPRLPGKFEAVNFPAVNATDLSAGIDTVQQVNLPRETTGISKAYSSETNFTAVTASPTQRDSISHTPVVQEIYSDAALFRENEHADQVPAIKNTIPVKREISTDKKDMQDNSVEILNKQEMPLHSEIKPLIEKPLVNLVNEKNSTNDFEQQEIPERFLLNRYDDKGEIATVKEGALHQHISILKQKIVKASAEKKNNVAEDKITIQPGLIRPVMNELNVRTNLNTSAISNDQAMSSVIKVSIGRIEVRAVTNGTPAKVNRTVLQKPNLTLDDYLKRRNSNGK